MKKSTKNIFYLLHTKTRTQKPTMVMYDYKSNLIIKTLEYIVISTII
jgi:hypothetical protein